VIEYLPSKCKILSSNSSTVHKKKNQSRGLYHLISRLFIKRVWCWCKDRQIS
jgi:hypothetical protein